MKHKIVFQDDQYAYEGPEVTEYSPSRNVLTCYKNGTIIRKYYIYKQIQPIAVNKIAYAPKLVHKIEGILNKHENQLDAIPSVIFTGSCDGYRGHFTFRNKTVEGDNVSLSDCPELFAVLNEIYAVLEKLHIKSQIDPIPYFPFGYIEKYVCGLRYHIQYRRYRKIRAKNKVK